MNLDGTTRNLQNAKLGTVELENDSSYQDRPSPIPTPKKNWGGLVLGLLALYAVMSMTKKTGNYIKQRRKARFY